MTLNSMMIPVMGGSSLLSWNGGTFANASGDRYIVGPDGTLYGPFGAGVPAIANIDGKNYYQSEAAATNLMDDIDAWTLRGTAARTAAESDPVGGSSAFKLEGVGTGANDVFYQYAGATVDAGVSPSVFLKRISASGVLRLTARPSSGDGDWDIDLSLLSDGWERITSDHPAVTVNIAFVNNGSGDGGQRFAATSGTLDFYAWRPQQEEADYPSSPIDALVTRPADVMLFTAAQVPTVMREGKWKYNLIMQGTHLEFNPNSSTSLEFQFKTYPSTNGVRISGSTVARTQLYDYRVPGTLLITASSSVTWSRQQVVTKKWDTVAGELTLEGYTTGDGVTSGTSWSGNILATDGASLAGGFPLGLISEPEAW